MENRAKSAFLRHFLMQNRIWHRAKPVMPSPLERHGIFHESRRQILALNVYARPLAIPIDLHRKENSPLEAADIPKILHNLHLARRTGDSCDTSARQNASEWVLRHPLVKRDFLSCHIHFHPVEIMPA